MLNPVRWTRFANASATSATLTDVTAVAGAAAVEDVAEGEDSRRDGTGLLRLVEDEMVAEETY